MSKVIRISDDTYKQLESLATGRFVKPGQLISELLSAYFEQRDVIEELTTEETKDLED